MAIDVARIRRQYPALDDGHAWLDGAGGTQVPRTVIETVADAYRAGMSNLGGASASSRRAGRVVEQARAAIADLVAAPDPACVVFGPSTTALTYRFAAALAEEWTSGDEVIVSELDHDANVSPWVQAARHRGVAVRVAKMDPVTGELPTAAVTELIGTRTRVVAVTAASNLLGTMPDLPAIAARARQVGAVTFVDGVQHCPHAHVRVGELGADFYATSAYKWAGPHLAAVVSADPRSLDALRCDKLAPAPDRSPERFELGTHPFASMAGVIAAVEHLAELDPVATGTRGEKLARSRVSLREHEDALTWSLLDGLDAMDGVVSYGTARRRTPTALFGVPGVAPAELARRLAQRGVTVSHGHCYAWSAVHALGLGPSGAVRASLCHYNDESDVRRLFEALGEVVDSS